MTLSNRQKADVLKYAYRSAPLVEYGLFHFRVALFNVFSGTKISPDRVANFYAPPGLPLGSGQWPSMEYLIDTVAKDPGVEMKLTQLFLLITDY